ncbi:carbohydrate ABC transporter permease [Kitasatospora purpeofusca]|uniref:carbohydrate ABC transporter permease n=1 Tax=Kitasatospora purpeofusca TaxID=67352 RepID=UPI000A809568|nr:carbohydrate ABC transporter permease [Kitasatospora purpeofusca]MCX4755390.1 carbohydrate ABC transporter permease [Kitasatospora purpeofusca]WSR36736.1 carbohydrate ABC transporter permease [Kitasatospora purpeofusca]WSR45018.1 carbohydrate ABC transporter permease [Kitasatospora purpeofusca]
MKATNQAGRAGVIAVLVLAALYSLLPVWWLVVSATKSSSDLFSSNGFWFAGRIELVKNVSTLLGVQDGIFGRWLLNSLLYAVGGAVVATLLSSMAGYVLAKYAFRGREAVFNTVLGAILIPAPLFALPLYLMFSAAHVVNTFWAVFIPSIVSPFGVYLARIYAAASVPDELLEAGRLDGAGEFRIFRSVALRVLQPSLVTIFLFQFVTIWTNYLLPSLMLANDRLQPVTVGLVAWKEQRGQTVPYNLIITGSLLSVVPIVVMFLLLQRYWKAGLTSGSVK